MESDSQGITNRSMPSLDLQSENGSTHQSERPDAYCIFCRRTFLLDAETGEGFDAIFICRDCKIFVLDDLDTDTATRESTQRSQGRFDTAESVEDVFSQQFSELIDLARSNRQTEQRAGYGLNQSRPIGWRPLSFDNGGENFEHVDSLLSENDSTISSSNGCESDASLDGHGFLDRDFFAPQDGESRISSDTDVDPMHAGQDHWNSDDQDDEDDHDGEWEEDSDGETSGQGRHFLYTSNSPTGSSGRETQNDGWLFWRTHDHGSMNLHIFNVTEEPELPRYFGNSGDYLDAQGFETLLEQFAETESSRRGAPPAAASFVSSLPRVTISKAHEKNGSLICAVCKDSLPLGTETNQLPCLHFYHPSCILPWLRTRNSCPVCRYEAPTDDPDYEAGKRIMGSRREPYEAQEQNTFQESSPDVPTGRREGQGDPVVAESEDYSNRRRRGGRWTYIAPIVSIVGMVLVMWLGIPLAEGRSRSFQRNDSREPAGGNSSQANQDGRHRRWFFFQ